MFSEDEAWGGSHVPRATGRGDRAPTFAGHCAGVDKRAGLRPAPTKRRVAVAPAKGGIPI